MLHQLLETVLRFLVQIEFYRQIIVPIRNELRGILMLKEIENIFCSFLG